MSIPKYAWVGNQISQDDMGRLYHLKVNTGVPITRHVAEAVGQYLRKVERLTKKNKGGDVK